jgi:hypothetical protein
VFDAARIEAYQQHSQVLDRTHNTFGLPLQRRFSPAVESRLVGLDFHEDPVAHPRIDYHRRDSGDFQLFLLEPGYRPYEILHASTLVVVMTVLAPGNIRGSGQKSHGWHSR